MHSSLSSHRLVPRTGWPLSAASQSTCEHFERSKGKRSKRTKTMINLWGSSLRSTPHQGRGPEGGRRPAHNNPPSSRTDQHRLSYNTNRINRMYGQSSPLPGADNPSPPSHYSSHSPRNASFHRSHDRILAELEAWMELKRQHPTALQPQDLVEYLEYRRTHPRTGRHRSLRWTSTRTILGGAIHWLRCLPPVRGPSWGKRTAPATWAPPRPRRAEG